MSSLLIDALGAPVAATWTRFAPETPPQAWVQAAYPLVYWRDALEVLPHRPKRTHGIGLWLTADVDLAQLANVVEDFNRLPIIAIDFAKFADGRGYSLAQRLRGRYHFSGELRAIGNVLTDQLAYLVRAGFDQFELQAGNGANLVDVAVAKRTLDAARRALSAFSQHYQQIVPRSAAIASFA